jgi:hypothetical protein
MPDYVSLRIKKARTHAQEVRTRIAGGTLMLFSIAIVVDLRFEWPGQTHIALFCQAT